VKEDRDEARRRLELAAGLGSARAQFQLGYMSLYGKAICCADLRTCK
jgi:TPR repeat protein